MAKKTLSAIIACYRDAQSIPLMHRRLTKVLTKLKVNYELIFVNDGSPDTTEEILAKLARTDRHMIAVNHSRNFGSQMAFTSGMDVATGDAVVLLDGDLQDPPELIEQFYNTWKKGYDVVYGIRESRDASLCMRLCAPLFYKILRRVSYITIPPDAGDFSLIDKRVIHILKQMPERDRFLRGLRAYAGFSQTGIPYHRPARMFGDSTNSFTKNIGWAVKGIFNFSFVPITLLTALSLLLFFLTFISLVIGITVKFLTPDTNQGASMILIAVLFIGAVQMLGLAIVGHYISILFEEVKQRPRYIIKSIIRK